MIQHAKGHHMTCGDDLPDSRPVLQPSPTPPTVHHAICQSPQASTQAPAAPPARLLVLDDDADLRGLLARYLGAQGFIVRALANSEQLYQLLAQESFDALVLDVMMPGEDGLAVCARLRAQGESLPILMLTAHVDKVNREVGLETGADDYMTKPFEPLELLARLNVLLGNRRAKHHRALPASYIAVGTWAFDTVGGRLMRGQDEALELEPSEWALLSALASQPHQPLSREQLIGLARENGVDITDRTIDLHITRLRRLVELDANHPHLIQTVWGVGYVFVPSMQR